MHDTEPVRHRSPLRAGALVLASTVAVLTGLLFSTQSGAYAAYDPGAGFKLPSSMQGDFTNGGTRLESGAGSGAWLGTKSAALIELKLKQGTTANDDQSASGVGAGGWQNVGSNYAAPISATQWGWSDQVWSVTQGGLNAASVTITGTAGWQGHGIRPYARCTAQENGAGNPFEVMSTFVGGPITIVCPSSFQYLHEVIVKGGGYGYGHYRFTGSASAGGSDPERTGTPYARCANLSGDEISVYGTPMTYRESEATGIVGTPAPSFTLPTCPASHPVRMGWGFQGPSGPLATVTAPPIPAGLSACAGYACDVQSQPTTAAQECHQLNPDGTVSTTPGGPCPPGESGYCMWGPYSLDAAECAGAPQADPVEVEQDPGCTPDGLANLNPFAWMGGIPCLFKYLFIPDGDAWGNAGASIGAAWDGTAPAVVLDEGNKVFAPVVALQDVTTGDCQGPPFTFPSLAGVTEPFTLHPLSTCNELATYLLGIYLPVATAMTYLGGFFSGTRLLLKSAGAESPVKDA